MYIALNEPQIRNSLQHAKDDWQPKTPPWVFTSAASFYFHREFLTSAASFSFLPWAFLFCLELFFSAVSFSFLPWAFLFCRERFSFAVSFSVLPWAFLFCRELFFIAVALVGHRMFPPLFINSVPNPFLYFKSNPTETYLAPIKCL